jgi:hypothetical protein
MAEGAKSNMNQDVMALFADEQTAAVSVPPSKSPSSHGNRTNGGPVVALNSEGLNLIVGALNIVCELEGHIPFALELARLVGEAVSYPATYNERVYTVAPAGHEPARISSKVLIERELKAASALGPVGPIAAGSGPKLRGPEQEADFFVRESDADVLDEFADEGPEAFAAAPLPPTAAEGGTHTYKGPPFRLTPPPGPMSKVAPMRKIRNGPPPPMWAFPEMFALCFAADDPMKRRTISKAQNGRVANALSTLVAGGADLTRLGEFKTWWWGWATRNHPSPEKVVELWWRAMGEIDGALPKTEKPVVGAVRYDHSQEDGPVVDDSGVRRLIYG